MNMIRSMVVTVLATVAVLMTGGCAEMYVVSCHNDQVDLETAAAKHNAQSLAMQRAKQEAKGAVQLGVMSGGEPYMAVDLLAITRKGYMGAWREIPGQMAVATGADALGTGLLVGGTYYLTRNNSKSDSVSVTGDGNHINYNGGGGNQSTTTDNSSRSGQ